MENSIPEDIISIYIAQHISTVFREAYFNLYREAYFNNISRSVFQLYFTKHINHISRSIYQLTTPL
mgnify:CR=1 FL=1